jgi:molybdate transport system substrate-binding protein
MIYLALKFRKISIGNPDMVQVGEYSLLALTDAGLWSQLKNKVVLSEDVKQVLVYVERGDVDAGFVYITDAKTAQPGTINIVTIVPVSTSIDYPIAVVSSSTHKEKAQKFIDFVTGKDGQDILNTYGFVLQS